jgi:hypothetical protein
MRGASGIKFGTGLDAQGFQRYLGVQTRREATLLHLGKLTQHTRQLDLQLEALQAKQLSLQSIPDPIGRGIIGFPTTLQIARVNREIKLNQACASRLHTSGKNLASIAQEFMISPPPHQS